MRHRWVFLRLFDECATGGSVLTALAFANTTDDHAGPPAARQAVGGRPLIGQRETETEAESVAFVVCAVLGLQLG
jgi:hypothetical protein